MIFRILASSINIEARLEYASCKIYMCVFINYYNSFLNLPIVSVIVNSAIDKRKMSSLKRINSPFPFNWLEFDDWYFDQ